MITLSDLEKFDPSGMYKIYDQWPEIAKKAYESNYDEVAFNGIDHIVFAGMGGSGAIGDLFFSILSKSNIHVSLVKGYLLPRTINKNTLVIVTSVSGNSLETLTILESANKLDCSLIAFSSGGKMERFCKDNKIHYRKIELFHSPRTSLIKYVYSILRILNSILPITKDEITESINELVNIRNNIGSHNLSESNYSLELAGWISSIPLIYYPHGLESTAIRFKSSLQENAKSHAIIEDVIEACHNGIVAWEKTSSIQPILIRGKDDYIKTKERWEIIKEYFSKNKIDFKEVYSINGNILSKIIVLTYLLDYSSIYNAVINKIDPTPVRPIDFIKSKL
ncbi:MAG: putative bifunctional phosphoglucose/phosphomannose isomerase [Nitrosarchaeum sp.]|nr:putative bifunctional phosphoglucose/phosphomannose isomerase [Nitrosarchaeum sp.]